MIEGQKQMRYGNSKSRNAEINVVVFTRLENFVYFLSLDFVIENVLIYTPPFPL